METGGPHGQDVAVVVVVVVIVDEPTGLAEIGEAVEPYPAAAGGDVGGEDGIGAVEPGLLIDHFEGEGLQGTGALGPCG